MDYDLWLKLSSLGAICYTPKILADFRIHALSKTMSEGHKFWKEVIKVKRKYGVEYLSWDNRVVLTRLVRSKIVSLLRL